MAYIYLLSVQDLQLTIMHEENIFFEPKHTVERVCQNPLPLIG
jgi:hypothetical protein